MSDKQPAWVSQQMIDPCLQCRLFPHSWNSNVTLAITESWQTGESLGKVSLRPLAHRVLGPVGHRCAGRPSQHLLLHHFLFGVPVVTSQNSAVGHLRALLLMRVG